MPRLPSSQSLALAGLLSLAACSRGESAEAAARGGPAQAAGVLEHLGAVRFKALAEQKNGLNSVHDSVIDGR